MKINYKQLAFILDINPLEAFEKIVYAWGQETNKQPPQVYRDQIKVLNKVTDYGQDWPREIDLSLVVKHLHLPELETCLVDIQENFLKRPASKKWILCDYPEKKLETTPRNKIKIPSVLASLLPDESIETIKSEWNKRFGIPL